MIIVKIGGGSSINIEGIIRDLSNLNQRFIIINGANSLRDGLAKKLNCPLRKVTSISGYSSVLSDETTIDLQMMAYAGLRNKRIVELCHRYGINAVGLSGIDGKIIEGERNKGIKIFENGKKKIVRDLSGKPKKVNATLLNLLLDNGFVPVLSVPIIDEYNCAINSENDEIVNVINNEFKAEKIINLIEAPGFLKDIDDPNSLVKKMSVEDLTEWEKKSSGGIKRKLLAFKKLLSLHKMEIIISDGRVVDPILDSLKGKGTVIS